MKLVRFGAAGKEKPGIIDKNGKIRDLSKVVKDIDGEALSPAGPRQDQEGQHRQAAAGEGQSAARPLRRAAVELHRHRPELCRPRRRGRHAAAAKEPIIFNKALSCICGPNDNTITPKGSTQARLRGRARHRDRQARAAICKKEQAMSAVAGYFLSQRRVRARVPDRARRPVDQGQGLRDVRPDRPLGRHQGRDQGSAEPQHLAQGQRRDTASSGNTKTMVFGVAEIVWWCSQYFIMEPGDIIVTGTPSGVALGMKPPKFLKVGDVVRARLRRARRSRSRRSSRRVPEFSAHPQNESPGPRPGALHLQLRCGAAAHHRVKIGPENL